MGESDSPFMVGFSHVHTRTMLKTAAGIALILMLWNPMEPARRVTASVLHTAADLIAR